jgi:hypothetical protein
MKIEILEIECNQCGSIEECHNFNNMELCFNCSEPFRELRQAKEQPFNEE